MIIFETSPTDVDYPGKLREVRQQLNMSQREFAEAAGHSGIMQGRYETDRKKSNSASPSDKTANRIRDMIARVSTTQASASPNSHVTFNKVPRSLKAVTAHEIEQAIASAIGSLIGMHCTVTVKDVVWSGVTASDAAISLSVTT